MAFSANNFQTLVKSFCLYLFFDFFLTQSIFDLVITYHFLPISCVVVFLLVDSVVCFHES